MAENKSIIYYMSQFESPAIAKFPDHCIMNSGIAKGVPGWACPAQLASSPTQIQVNLDMAFSKLYSKMVKGAMQWKQPIF